MNRYIFLKSLRNADSVYVKLGATLFKVDKKEVTDEMDRSPFTPRYYTVQTGKRYFLVITGVE